MRDRYPGYDVLSKHDSLSWNDSTRHVIDARVDTPDEPHFFDADEWLTLNAICDRIIPQSAQKPRVPIAALVDGKMQDNALDGYRRADMPPMQDAWRLGLAALDASAQTIHGCHFHELAAAEQDQLLQAMQLGNMHGAAWCDMAAATFFSHRVLHDVVCAYYSHPFSWNAMGFGGPASPRGYARLYFNRHDPWEATEATDGNEAAARKANEHVG